MRKKLTLRAAAWILLVLVMALPVGAEEPSAQAALADAWHLLEVERKPEEAARCYEALSRRAKEPSLRARALLGWARAKRLLGEDEEAQRLLGEALRLAPEIASLRTAEKQRVTAAGPSRYFTGRVQLTVGEGLDLDGGGVYPGSRTWAGGRAEVFHGPDGLVRPRGAVEDESMARHVAVGASRPWLRMETDEGRLAWFQVLVAKPQPLVRFVTRVSGTGAVLPEVRRAFGLGLDRDGGASGGMEVWFEQNEVFSTYRVEAQREAQGPFQTLGEMAAPPFVHTAAAPATRYAYRVTGLDAKGNAGIPTSFMGTSTSRGIVTGSVDMRRGQSFDLLRGEEVAAGGDLKLVNTYGGASGGGFVDAQGRPVLTIEAAEAEPRTLWDGRPLRNRSYVDDGGQFLLPLRGGGVARCRLEMLSGERAAGGSEARVHYEAQPDGIAFPPAPRLRARATAAGVEVRLTDLHPEHDVPFVVARDQLGDAAPRELRDQTAAGVFLDTHVRKGGEHRVRYEATTVDRFGRRGVMGTGYLDTRSARSRRGTFKLHYKQGWSFPRGAVVPASEADVVFSGCAGGISSITLTAPGGITNLEDSLRPPLFEDRRFGGPDLLAECIHGVIPESVRLKGRAGGDRRRPAADVFVLRLKSGGWARLAIVERAKHAKGGWQKQPATFSYAWNPLAPRFEEDDPSVSPELRDHGFLVTNPSVVVERHREARLGHLPQKPTPGAFAFHYKQGYSFETGKVVDSASEADVFFQTCAGGISSITLTAAAGIMNLEGSGLRGRDADRETLLDAIVGVNADWPMRSTSRRAPAAQGDSRTPSSDVFVLRTRNGGWAKMAILARGSEGGWTDNLASVRFVFNPSEPVFVDDAGKTFVHESLTLRASAASFYPAIAKKSWAKSSPAAPTKGGGPTLVPRPEAYLTVSPAEPPKAAPWLADYLTHRATAKSYDRLREDLLRSPDDKLVVSGLVYLAGAHDPYYRRLAARSLSGAYVLGVQGGVGAADGMRRLARDPDPWVRYHTLANSHVFDTPLGREVLLLQLDGRAPIPDTEMWSGARRTVERRVKEFAAELDITTLVEKGNEALRASWIAAAPVHPATADTDRFDVIVLEDGKPQRYVLEKGDPAMGISSQGILLTASGFTVLRDTTGLGSSDGVTLHQEFSGGGSVSSGGGGVYAASASGIGGTWHHDLTRVIGEGRVRVWRRVVRK